MVAALGWSAELGASAAGGEAVDGAGSQDATRATSGGFTKLSINTRPSMSSPMGSPNQVRTVGATSRTVAPTTSASPANPGPHAARIPCGDFQDSLSPALALVAGR